MFLEEQSYSIRIVVKIVKTITIIKTILEILQVNSIWDQNFKIKYLYQEP